MSNQDEIELICAANAECDRLQAKIIKLEHKIEEQTRQIEEQAFQLGNQGYRIKNQRHEINNRLKENAKLKDLLRELTPAVNWTFEPYKSKELTERIKSALGESEE